MHAVQNPTFAEGCPQSLSRWELGRYGLTVVGAITQISFSLVETGRGPMAAEERKLTVIS